jgi:hypothetical protein
LKFLGRAKKFLQDLGTESSAQTQYFNVACAGGHRVRGERTEGYQALRCPVCGEGVFVLPRSPLPEPEAPEGAPQRRRASGRTRNAGVDDGPIELTNPGQGEAEIVWDDEPAEVWPPTGVPTSAQIAPEDLAAAEIEAARRAEAAAANRGGGRAVARRAEADPSRSGRTRPDGQAPGTRPRPETAKRPGAGRAGRPVTEPELAPGSVAVKPAPHTRRGPRIGLIFFLLTVLIAATVGWRVWMNHRAEFPRIIERGKVEGIPALEAGEFDRAHQLLSAARSAVEALGGAVAEADEIRQAADEAAIFNNLCSTSLEELLAEAGRASDPESWASTFDALYKGRSCLFDTFIEFTPEDSESGAYELGYVVFPPGEASRFGDGGVSPPDRFARIDLRGFEAIEQSGLKREARVTFGARLQSIVYDSGRKYWVVRLEPKSGVFITHHGALVAIGRKDLDMVEIPREDQP